MKTAFRNGADEIGPVVTIIQIGTEAKHIFVRLAVHYLGFTQDNAAVHNGTTCGKFGGQSHGFDGTTPENGLRSGILTAST
ncbi:hypothetical protein [Formivibrio citricus]|uniref:hypothetical protein n=1 Tax=Formivibrio citricus TaxID=83765 RepID=UPI0011605485|nr:hypothetical protein [Formivibrio citricus]